MTEQLAVEKGLYLPSTPGLFTDYFAANLSGKTFLDLGSGTGEIVDLALQHGAIAKGVEWETAFVTQSLARFPSLTDEIIEQGDFFDKNFNDYEVLFYYFWGTFAQNTLITRLNEYSGLVILNLEECAIEYVNIFKQALTCDYVAFGE